MTEVWTCPYCEYLPHTEYGLKIHIRENHRTYGVAGQCQAYLLTPESRRWKKFTKQSIRCKYAAKDLLMPFCGNHAKLADAIEEIVWKNDG